MYGNTTDNDLVNTNGVTIDSDDGGSVVIIELYTIDRKLIV